MSEQEQELPIPTTVTKTAPTQTTKTRDEELETVDVLDTVSGRQGEGIRENGVWCYLGDAWQGVEVKLRPFGHTDVLAARTRKAESIRARLGIPDTENIPPDYETEIVQTSVVMSVVAARGNYRVYPEEMEAARVAMCDIRDVRDRSTGERVSVVQLSGDEPTGEVREMFASIFAHNKRHDVPGLRAFMLRIAAATRRLQEMDPRRIDDLGKDFVLGRDERVDWDD